MKWTTEKLNTFFAMKDQGYSLAEIAAELGCTYYAAQTQSKNMKRTKKKAEVAKKMEDRVTEVTEVTETNVSTEAPTETEAPIEAPTATPIGHIAEAGKKVSRVDILDNARAIVTGEREKQYGKPEDNFAIIAELWGAYTGYKFSPVDVAMMMVLLKVARIKTGVGTVDSFVDLAGYAACAGEIAGKGATASVQPAGDTENGEAGKQSDEINGAQNAE